MEFDATMAAVGHKGSYAIACGISKFGVESTRSRVVDHSALNFVAQFQRGIVDSSEKTFALIVFG